MASMTDEEFFRRLRSDQPYSSFLDLKTAADRAAVNNVSDFPPQFRMRTYLDFAIKRGWIVRTAGGLEVMIPEQAASSAD